MIFALSIASKASSAPPRRDHVLPWSADSGFETYNYTGTNDYDCGSFQTYLNGLGDTEHWNIEHTKPLLSMNIKAHRSEGIMEDGIYRTLRAARDWAQQIADRLPSKEEEQVTQEYVFRSSDEAEAHFKLDQVFQNKLYWKDILDVLNDEGLRKYFVICRRFTVTSFSLDRDGVGQIGNGGLLAGPGNEHSTPIPSGPDPQPSLAHGTLQD